MPWNHKKPLIVFKLTDKGIPFFLRHCNYRDTLKTRKNQQGKVQKISFTHEHKDE